MSSKKHPSRGKEEIDPSTRNGAGTGTGTNKGRPNSTLILTNLRLLGFEQRNDWPTASSQPILQANLAQVRRDNVYFIEWILYRLFELWDAELTREVSGT